MSTETSDPVFGIPTDMMGLVTLAGRVLYDACSTSSPLDPPSAVDLALDNDPHRLEDVLAEVADKVVPHSVRVRHPWAMAHMVPPPLTAAVLADFLIGALNQCAFIWEEAPLAAALEREVVAWLRECVGFEREGPGLLTSGGTSSNTIAAYLALVRAEDRGVSRDRFGVVVSDQAHLSVAKAAALTGLSASAVSRAETDSYGRLVPGALGRAAASLVAEGRVPCLFVSTAGTTNAGLVEPLDEALEAAAAHDAWVHLDAAHGGLLALVGDPRTEAWPQVDSISWDPHKSLYVSYSCGALLLRDPSTREPLRFHAEYALKQGEFADAGIEHLDGSRRLEALKLWMCIRQLGRSGYSTLTEASLERAAQLAAEIEGRPELELAAPVETNIVCFRLAIGTPMEALDELHERIQRSLFTSGGPLLSTTRLGRQVVFRAVLLKPNVTRRDLSDALDRVIDAARRIAHEALEPADASL